MGRNDFSGQMLTIKYIVNDNIAIIIEACVGVECVYTKCSTEDVINYLPLYDISMDHSIKGLQLCCFHTQHS